MDIVDLLVLADMVDAVEAETDDLALEAVEVEVVPAA